jgi:Right handed beta helix region
MRNRAAWRFLTSLLLVLAGTSSTSRAASATAISQCPYAINAAGAYFVTQNLRSVGTCILIAANGVSVDLQTHTIAGNGTGFGITDGGNSAAGIVVTNGTIQTFDTGIAFDGGGRAVTVAAMLVQNNRNGGIRILGLNTSSPSTVVNSTANNNGGEGIQLCCGTVFNSEASGNGTVGIGGGPGLSIQSSKADGNGGHGIFADGEVIGVTANGNGGSGIRLDSSPGSSVITSTALQNVGSGISLLCPSTAVSNKSLHNSSGNLVEAPGSFGQPLDCVNFNNQAP